MKDTRVVKFRAWDEGKEIMHYDFQFIRSGEMANDWIVFTSDKQKLCDKPHPFENPYLENQFKIMQYTGLKNMEGKEIYEGDILCFPKYKDSKNIFHHAWVVEWDGEDCRFTFWSPRSNVEIIGNIYETPELLVEQDLKRKEV